MNKKGFVLFLISSLALSAIGCQDILGNEDGYSAGKQISNKEAYLDYSVLHQSEGASETYEFEVYTLEYGRFSTVMSPISASVSSMITPIPVKVEYSAGQMEFVSLNVQRYQAMKKGDVIANVRMEVDDIDLEELTIKLTRLEEEYKQVVDAHMASQEELLNQAVYSKNQSRIRDLKWQREGFKHQKTVESYEKQLEDIRETIAQLKANRNITEILAPEDGYIMSVTYFRTGDELKNGQTLVTYVTEDQICLEYDDSLIHYGYGMLNSISLYCDRKALAGDTQVVSISGKQLSASWNRQTTKFKSDITADKLLQGQHIMISGETNVMDNVLLIPKEAVTEENGNTYVTVLRADGKLEKRAFLAGGKNSVHYWVFDGLTEGTQIVIEN